MWGRRPGPAPVLAGCGGSSAPAPVFGGKSVQEDQEWPQELMGGDGSTVLLYQPQVESWKDYKLLRARMAVAFRRMGTAGPGPRRRGPGGRHRGQQRGGSGPDLEHPDRRGALPRRCQPGESDRLLNALRARMTKEDVVVALERLTAYLERAETALTAAPLKADPPKIFVSTRPAVLVVLDGAPVMAPVPGTDLKYAVNTNWDLLRDGDGVLPPPRTGLAHRARSHGAVDTRGARSHRASSGSPRAIRTGTTCGRRYRPSRWRRRPCRRSSSARRRPS